METAQWLWILLLVGGLLILAGRFKLTRKAGFSKLIGGALAVLAGFAILSPASISGLPLIGGLVPGASLLSVAGTSSSSGSSSTTASGYAIETMTVSAIEAESNDAAAVDGYLLVFDAAANPSAANANPIDSVTVTDGVGSTSAAKIKEGQQYRVVFEGNSTGSNYYDKDFGVMSFSGLNPQTGKASFAVGDISLVGTLADILDETVASNINGQTTTYTTDEVYCSTVSNASTGCTADLALTYDESTGDSVWFIDVSPGVSTANAIAKGAVLQFKFDTTNPPEGNEYSTITAQLRSGTDLGVPSSITNYWANEIPIDLGDMQAGESATYRITFTVNELNEDGNDDWTLRFDDLGEHLGKDVRLNTRATADTVTYAGSSA